MAASGKRQKTAREPATFLSAAAALAAIEEALTEESAADGVSRADQAVAALLLLRDMREQLSRWEGGLIETARDAGASWADLARPLGVASRQAAERRYLRVRDHDADGTTGDQRVKAERDRRAAQRTVTAWARANAGDLRRLAGQICSLPDLGQGAAPALAALLNALGSDDAAQLLMPLAATVPHLRDGHSELAERVDAVTGHTEVLRQQSDLRRQ